MEIKTCEHFVVNRLMELEDKVASYESLVAEQQLIIQNLEEKLSYARGLIVVNKAHDYTPENPRMYIDMRTVWNTYDKDRFNEMCRVFDLSLIDEGEEEEE